MNSVGHSPLPPAFHWGGHPFSIWPMSQVVDAVPGLYVYSLYINGRHFAAYIGESEDVAQRVARHRVTKYYPVRDFHNIHCLPVRDGEKARKRLKKQLVAAYNPPLNTWHRTGPAAPQIIPIVPDRWKSNTADAK